MTRQSSTAGGSARDAKAGCRDGHADNRGDDVRQALHLNGLEGEAAKRS